VAFVAAMSPPAVEIKPTTLSCRYGLSSRARELREVERVLRNARERPVVRRRADEEGVGARTSSTKRATFSP
jgi:hypothetical protein